MAQEQTAYLYRSSIPERLALQAAVDALGFDLKIDESYAPWESQGFLPCRLLQIESGFEIYFDEAMKLLQDFPNLGASVAGRDSAITFRWGGDMRELACVLIVSAALAKGFRAIVHYHGDDMPYSVDQLIQDATAVLREIG